MTSSEQSAENEPNVTPQSRRGRRKMRRDRSNTYRKITLVKIFRIMYEKMKMSSFLDLTFDSRYRKSAPY
jgi:hypothetical protein